MTATNTRSGPDLGEQLSRALQKDRPLTWADREADDSFVSLVLNPGAYSCIGNRRFGPGEIILVSEEQAAKLTTPSQYRPFPAARHLDEPEPNTRGNFPQPHGPGRYHPDSSNHTAPEDEPVEPGEGQHVTDDGELAEGEPDRSDGEDDNGQEGDDGGYDRGRQGGGRHERPSRAANSQRVGDGGKSYAGDAAGAGAAAAKNSGGSGQSSGGKDSGGKDSGKKDGGGKGSS